MAGVRQTRETLDRIKERGLIHERARFTPVFVDVSKQVHEITRPSFIRADNQRMGLEDHSRLRGENVQSWMVSQNFILVLGLAITAIMMVS